MITISYQLLAFIIIMELTIILLIQWIYKMCKKEDITECNYTVVSKRTGYEYDCIAIRTCKDYTYEVKIYNYFTGEYEWCPYYDFKFFDK
jgi:hypothetical protein